MGIVQRVREILAGDTANSVKQVAPPSTAFNQSAGYAGKQGQVVEPEVTLAKPQGALQSYTSSEYLSAKQFLEQQAITGTKSALRGEPYRENPKAAPTTMPQAPTYTARSLGHLE